MRRNTRLVSIHAPARGATVLALSWMPERTFRSTRPRGARPINEASYLVAFLSFDPRAREGRDLFFPSCTLLKRCFDPRAREGRDFPPFAPNHFLFGFDPRAREGRDQ
ncbi:hypothetical protein NB311A_20281 [Nitrobacter sp. Nb-311A]|nr:hypothetical protein NB311A_20281 [Nitrobacter sp. Nb-311A]